MAIEAALPLDAAFEVALPPAPYPGLRPFERRRMADLLRSGA